jgi:putative nucleotidyltransferase with HDIG domain
MTTLNGDKAKQKLLSSFTSNIPPFPKCVQRVMAMLRDPRIQLTKVAEVVSLDQGFAGKVLRMANSAYFGLPRRVHNVTEALVLLGYTNVRNVLISASAGHLLCGVVESYGFEAGRLWEHSVGSAYGAQMLSRKADVRVYSMAFSAGLLHDVGKVAIDRALDDEARKQMCALVTSIGEKSAEKQIVGLTHAEVGGEICRRWNLPPEIIEAVAYHHAPACCESGSKLPGIVAAANQCTKILIEGHTALTPANLASAPSGSYMPDAGTLGKLSEDLPAMITSAKELIQGITEVVKSGGHHT